MKSIFINGLIFIIAIIVALIIGEAAGRWLFYSKQGFEELAIVRVAKFARVKFATDGLGLSGKDLNRRAWESSYEERGLSIPDRGPREGYWSQRLGKKKKHTLLGWTEPPLDMGDLFQTEKNGLQQVGHDSASMHLLIIGASVAWGSYASLEKNTYFSLLAKQLNREKENIKISVLAAGAWISSQEVMALLHVGLGLKPDVVLFLDGMNDISNIDESEIDRAKQFIENMKLARQICSYNNIDLIYALQPSIAEKKNKSALEQRVVQTLPPNANVQEIINDYQRIRTALIDLTDPQTKFLDCSNVFSNENPTTFADLWHFSDPGHQLLADFLTAFFKEHYFAQ